MKTIIKKFAIDMRVRVGYGSEFFLLLISYLLTLYANRQLLNQAKLVDHTNKVIIHLESMLSYMKDAETGCRGYIITKDGDFLEPYQQSKTSVDSVFRIIKEEISDNRSEKARLDVLYNLIQKKFELLAFAIDYFPKHDYLVTDSLKSVTYFGKEIMDRI